MSEQDRQFDLAQAHFGPAAKLEYKNWYLEGPRAHVTLFYAIRDGVIVAVGGSWEDLLKGG